MGFGRVVDVGDFHPQTVHLRVESPWESVLHKVGPLGRSVCVAGVLCDTLSRQRPAWEGAQVLVATPLNASVRLRSVRRV